VSTIACRFSREVSFSPSTDVRWFQVRFDGSDPRGVGGFSRRSFPDRRVLADTDALMTILYKEQRVVPSWPVGPSSRRASERLRCQVVAKTASRETSVLNIHEKQFHTDTNHLVN